MKRAGGRERPAGEGRGAVGGCPAAACFELLGRKWTGYILWALRDGPLRFTQLLEAVPGITDRVLSMRLRQLETAEVVTRRQFEEVPPRVEYALTRKGRDLAPVIAEMERWSRQWRALPRPAWSRAKD